LSSTGKVIKGHDLQSMFLWLPAEVTIEPYQQRGRALVAMMSAAVERELPTA
jgi:hypothetical protein